MSAGPAKLRVQADMLQRGPEDMVVPAREHMVAAMASSQPSSRANLHLSELSASTAAALSDQYLIAASVNSDDASMN
jgi:hypothetical protein